MHIRSCLIAGIKMLIKDDGATPIQCKSKGRDERKGKKATCAPASDGWWRMAATHLTAIVRPTPRRGQQLAREPCENRCDGDADRTPAAYPTHAPFSLYLRQNQKYSSERGPRSGHSGRKKAEVMEEYRDEVCPGQEYI